MTKQRILQLLLLWGMLLTGMPVWASQDGNVVLQEQWGRQVITVAADQEITFYDWKGTENISSTSSNNSRSLTVFKPAVDGQSIQITFESCDVTNDGASWMGQVWIYSGDPDPTGDFDYNATLSASSTMPSGNVLDKLDGTYTNKTYTSNESDGSLSVGMLWRYAKACAGWVAKVKCVTLENMTVTGAGSNYDGVGGELSSKQNVPLANVYVTTTGVMNPDNLGQVYFNMTKNESAMNPTALKIFKGDVQVPASINQDGGSYRFVLEDALSDGTNTYTIKGDFLGTAAVGAKVQVDVTKVVTTGHTDGVTPFTAGTSVEVVNPAIAIMTATPQTITVDETPLQFYDEGGKDGGILSKTNGQITFLSGVTGKKVMVDFTKNEIWHGPLYNQELRIYSGTEVNAANLIRTLQQGETGIVRSTADDGALTVVLFSDASNSIDANGWEATVSLFTPQPMDFNGITATAASTENVAAGDEAQDMLDITVKALNTEPAMQVTKMAFTTNGTNALVAKASLYFGSTKVGETAIAADAFDITLTTPQTLAEGDNLFTLKYDISDEALNDQKVAAKAVSVTALVNNAAKTENVTADAVERTVNNIVLSHEGQGTVTKTVNGSIAFETKPRSEYSSNYEYGNDDRINVFVPKHSGMVTQIDFSQFAIYYNSYNASSSAKFKIYNGQGTSGYVLWEPTAQTDYANGPGHVIRSTAADGALTVSFNANSTYSTAAGFKATVSEYQVKPMEVKTVEATQATTADASIGAADQELLNVNVKTEGDQNALAMSAMKLNLKGTEANITKVSVWKGETKLGESAAFANVTVNFSEALTLAEGDNLLTVKADVSESATENQTIDAMVTAVVIGGSDVAATAGDPEGARTLKNMVLMTAGDHGTLNLGLDKQVMIYDDGGPEGDGADGVTATITLAPTGEADCIRLTDKGLSFNYTSHLYLYKGGEENADNLIVDLSGSSAKFDPIVTDAAFDGGKLTIKYVGAGSYTKPNFAVEAVGYKKSDVAITKVTTEDISVNEVLKGQTDVKMLKVAVEAKGELTPAKITAFNLADAQGEALEASHIYQTGSVASFSANEVFDTEYEITNSGTYYFWLTYDVKTTAEVGQTATATLNSVTVNGTTIDVTDPATATITVASGKSGDYTVGQDGDYATIQGAIDDIGTLGMEGPVTLKIKAGEYNEKVRIPYIKGMGSVNTLTLESESGKRDVKIYENNYISGGYSDDQHKKDYGVITLYEASYVTLHNLEVTTTDATGYKALVMVKDGSRHITVDNCYLHAEIIYATSGDGVALVNHTIIDEENKNNDYLTVKNCLLEGGKYGVYMGGTSIVALPKEVGGVVEGNTFKNNGRFMMYSYDELGVKIRNNTFIIDDSNVKMSNGVIDVTVRDEYAESTEITGNVFNLASANTLAAIYVRQMEATEAAPAIIANNVVVLASANASCTPLKMSSNKTKNLNIANNTFRMTGTNGGPALFVSSALAEGYGNVNVVNNIIQNETNGYAVNLYNDANLAADKVKFENNLMYTDGETFFRAASATNGDFATFVEKTGATGCINKKVTFVTDDILMPANTLDGDLLKAKALTYVTTDITGKERPTENISIGAYEYAEDVIPQMAEDYPQVVSITHESAAVLVKADAMGKAFLVLTQGDEPQPTVDELLASDMVAVLTANTEAQFNLTGLAELTDYTAHVFLQSPAGQKDETKRFAAPFTTLKTPAPAPEAELFADAEGNTETTVELGESATLYAMMAEGEAPYTVIWTDAKHNELKTETFDELPTDLLTLEVTPTEHTDYYLTVKDSRNFVAADTVRVYVTSEELLPATFENLYLAEESWENGSHLQGSFVSGSFEFDNGAMPEWSFYYDFMYSNSTSDTFTTYTTDQFNSAAGGGYDGSENFAVVYPQAGKAHVKNGDAGAEISGFYITSNAWVADAVVNGDGMSGPFEKDDYLKLTITADNGNSLDYYLADYRAEKEADRYYIHTWEWVDLRSLGTVKTLSFSFDGTKKNAYGLTTPTYFCMDNLGGERAVADAETLNIANEQNEVTVSLKDYFSFENAEATIVYAFAEPLSEAVKADVTISEGNLVVKGTENDETFEVILCATQKGMTQYLRLPVNFTYTQPDGISGIYRDSNVEGRYDLGGRKLSDRSRGVNVVRLKDGTVRKVSVK